jgi:hypothetical protein
MCNNFSVPLDWAYAGASFRAGFQIAFEISFRPERTAASRAASPSPASLILRSGRALWRPLCWPRARRDSPRVGEARPERLPASSPKVLRLRQGLLEEPPGMGGFRHRSLHVELKNRFCARGALLNHPPPALVARPGITIPDGLYPSLVFIVGQWHRKSSRKAGRRGEAAKPLAGLDFGPGCERADGRARCFLARNGSDWWP